MAQDFEKNKIKKIIGDDTVFPILGIFFPLETA